MSDACVGGVTPDSVIRKFRIIATGSRTVKDSLTVRREGRRAFRHVERVREKIAWDADLDTVIKKYLITAADVKSCNTKRHNFQATTGHFDRFLALGGTEK